MNKKHLMLFVLAVAMGGCQYQASNWCSDAPFHNCKDLVDGPIDAATCSSNASCTAPLGVCDVTGSKTCVECTATDSAACVGVEPVCGADQACRACTAHSECISDVCLPDGSCAAEGDVAYVNGSTGTGSACTKAAPCKTVTAAIATPKAVIKVTGPVNDRVSIGRSVKIFAAPNAELSSAGNGTLLTTTGTATVEVYDLTIANASGVNVGYGVQVGANTTFAMTRGKITGCREAGLTAIGGTVTVTGATVSGNTGAGITASGGTVTVTGATLSGNTGGGLQLSGNGAYKFTNNFIVSNGSGTSAVGGIQIANVTQAGIFEFAFNTIYNNDIIPSAIAGVNCQTVGVPLAFKNNIVFANKVIAGGTQVGGSPMCQHTYSDIGPDTAGGTGNINADPLFVNVAQLNIHIQATSPAKDAADPAATLATDIDGDARPQGTSRDIGADEYKP